MSDQESNKQLEKQETLGRWKQYLETGDVLSNDTIMEWLGSWGTDEEKPCPVK